MKKLFNDIVGWIRLANHRRGVLMRKLRWIAMLTTGWVGCGGDDGGSGKSEADLSVVTAAEMSSLYLQFTCDYTANIHLEGSVDFEFPDDEEAPFFYFYGTGRFAGTGYNNFDDIDVVETALPLDCRVSMDPPEGVYQDYSRLVLDITCDTGSGVLGDYVYLFGSSGDPVTAEIGDVGCSLVSGTGSYTLTAPAAEFEIVNDTGP